jgi:hypothetical protein
MKSYSQFISDIQERYYEPDEKLPSGNSPKEKAQGSLNKLGDKPENERTTKDAQRAYRQSTRIKQNVSHGADNPDYNRHEHPDLEVSGHETKMRVTNKKSGITYSVNKDGKTKDGKDVHDVMWYRTDRQGNDLDSKQKKDLLRSAKDTWDKHVSPRMPHGSVVKNWPVPNSSDDNVTKNTRSKLYQRAGFGPMGKMGDQFASVGREPSSKEKAKGKKRLSPMPGDTKMDYDD